jgi:hypothetical protein
MYIRAYTLVSSIQPDQDILSLARFIDPFIKSVCIVGGKGMRMGTPDYG